jgi:isopenicillin N synthase-like dioxygenase
VGVYALTGHGIDTDALLQTAQDFHSLPTSVKQSLAEKNGMGYLPLNHQKLPARSASGNANESFVVKRHLSQRTTIDWSDNPCWPSDGWRDRVTAHATTLEQLAKRLLPLYARALDLPYPENFFGSFFQSPLLRLRLTRYPVNCNSKTDATTYGIHPHVDTSFLTMLIASGPGLVIYHPERRGWIEVPYTEGHILVNTGELARQWTNDRWVSVPHFVDSTSFGLSQCHESEDISTTIAARDRYAVPFFVSPTADKVMTCIPTCCNDGDNPPRYPPFSYESSQAVAQGE